MPSPRVYADVLEKRMKAKAAGDKATANALKLVVNTTYGASLNKYNDLYDPRMGRSVCITGQLFLLELAEHLYHAVPGLKIVQLNTDGIMIEFDDSQYPQVKAITADWEKRTGFDLEEDAIQQIAQKDVNNYVEVNQDGIKEKGGMLAKGFAKAGAFNVNYSNTIVSTAVKEFLLHNTLPEDTINQCQDPKMFQIIAKAGGTYQGVYHETGDGMEEIQKVNRVFATKDITLGSLYKRKHGSSTYEQIANLPTHCMVVNSDPSGLSLDWLDREYYIILAHRWINDFVGRKYKRNTKAITALKKKILGGMK